MGKIIDIKVEKPLEGLYCATPSEKQKIEGIDFIKKTSKYISRMLLIYAILFIACKTAFAFGFYAIGKVKSINLNSSSVTLLIPFSQCKGSRTVNITNINPDIKVGEVLHLYFTNGCSQAKIKEAPR